jgi:hypothetical protein
MELPRSPFISPLLTVHIGSAERASQQGRVMNRHKYVTLISGALLVLSAAPANAASCSSEMPSTSQIHH